MASPWKKSVAVTLESVNPLKYSIQPTGSDPLPTSNGALVFDNQKHAGFDIDFTFTDATNSGYLWPPNNLKGQAVWSKVGTSDTCPGSPDAEVFHATGVDKSCTVLSVNNPNPSPAQGAFQYTLCVTKDEGKSYLALDPGGSTTTARAAGGMFTRLPSPPLRRSPWSQSSPMNLEPSPRPRCLSFGCVQRMREVTGRWVSSWRFP